MIATKNQTEQFYQFLGNGFTEIRSLRRDGPPCIESACEADQFVDLVEGKNGEFTGVYCTINRINPNMANRVTGRKPTGDNDIERLTTLFVDIDPERESGKAATPAQHQQALDKADAIHSFLSAQSWQGIKVDSGNGAYCLYKIDLPPEDDWLVEQVLHSLDSIFSDEEVKVDTCVHNPARICRIPGTMNCKAEPYSECKLLTDDVCVPLVTREQLENVVAHYFRHVPRTLKPRVESTENIDPAEVDARERELIEYMGASWVQLH